MPASAVQSEYLDEEPLERKTVSVVQNQNLSPKSKFILQP